MPQQSTLSRGPCSRLASNDGRATQIERECVKHKRLTRVTSLAAVRKVTPPKTPITPSTGAAQDAYCEESYRGGEVTGRWCNNNTSHYVPAHPGFHAKTRHASPVHSCLKGGLPTMNLASEKRACMFTGRTSACKTRSSGFSEVERITRRTTIATTSSPLNTTPAAGRSEAHVQNHPRQ
jgi:hypothetical protein